MSDQAIVAPPSEEQAALLATPEYRVDGPDKVTGAAMFAGDMTRPGMLWAAFLGSPVPYGRIRSIDTSRAAAMPGVRAVLTGEDVRGVQFGRMLQDRPVLCWDVVRFVGDRLAAIAADTLEQAEAAVAAIDVEIDPLPPIFDTAAALAPDATVLHPAAGDYVYIAGARPAMPHPNVQGRLLKKRGEDDIEAVFARAAHVFEHTFTTPRHHQGYIEPHGTLVWVDDEGAHVVTTNKSPIRLRDQMARTLGIPPAQVEIISGTIGGDFGGKGYSIDEHACYFLAKATGRPVKAVTRYADELAAYNPRHAARMRLRTAVDADGRLLAHKAEMVYDGGAYASAKPMPYLTPAQGLATLAPYQIPNVEIEAIAVYTNTVPCGHMRAPGEVQAVFAGESHLDMIARELGVDPLELRLRNVIRSEADAGSLGDRFHGPLAAELFERLRTEMGWDRPLPDGHGRGVSMVVMHVRTAGPTTLRLRLGADGRLQVITGFPEQGSGQAQTIRRVIAAAASIDESRISIQRRTTRDAPTDPGVGGSWVTHMASPAARQLGEQVREWLEERAPRALPSAPEGVELRRDWLVNPLTGERLLGFGEAVQRLLAAGEAAEFTATYSPTLHAPGEPGDADFAAFGVEVAVDRETGTVRIIDAVVVADVGTIINPVAHAGQLEGGFAFGVGAALMEEVQVEDGVVVDRSMAEFKLPTIRDVPPLRIVPVQAESGPGAFGAKAAGELTNSQIAPAIANAVAAAVGARVTDLPLTPERVLAALRAGGQAAG